MILIKNITPLLLFLIIISSGQSCTSRSFGEYADSLFLVDDQLEVTYYLKRPSEKHFLPYVLSEVSGLTFRHPKRILAVDDESGRIFEYDLEKRDITHSIGFFKTDDYEGIELVGDDIYVLKHDGDIFHFSYTEDKEAQSIKYETELHSGNDTEGLGHNPVTNHLLIACKEDGHFSEEKIDGRAFYAFDLSTKKLITEPHFIIGPKELESFWESRKSIDYDQERIKFKPSAIATHPITGHYYVLSSIGKMLVVVSADGTIQGTYPISPRILGQPEGICFDPEGNMYISSEGEGDRGYILKFDMKKSGS